MGATPVLGIPYVDGDAIVEQYPIADKGQAEKVESLLLGSTGAAFGWAKQLAAQSIPASAVTALSGLTLDAASTGVTLVSGTTLKVPTAGLYLVVAQLSFVPNSTGSRSMHLYRNGSQVLRVLGQAATGWQPAIVGSWAFPMAANDTIQVFAYQSSGAALSTDATQNQNGFQVIRL